MGRTFTYESDHLLDLGRVYNELEQILNDFYGSGRQNDYLNRVERNFGQHDKNDVFIQTKDFNAFLYRDKITVHNLKNGYDLEKQDIEDEKVWQYLEKLCGEDITSDLLQ